MARFIPMEVPGTKEVMFAERASDSGARRCYIDKMYSNTKDLVTVAGAWRRAARKPWEKSAFEAWFLAHYEEIYRHLFRVVGSQQEAEDLAQETFLRLYRQRFPMGQEHNVRAWLYRVATNLAYNALRGHKRRGQREEKAARRAMTEYRPDADPAEAMLRQDEREMARRALANMRPRQVKLLLLRHVGLSYRELAEALGLAPGSIGTLLARAGAAFEKAYRKELLGAKEGERDEV